jgi:hypothetical protein
VLAERPDDHPRGPADVLERVSLAQELRGDEQTLAHHSGPVRETRRPPDRQGAPDDACRASCHGRGGLIESLRNLGHICGADIVDRRPNADDDEGQVLPGNLRPRHDPPGSL